MSRYYEETPCSECGEYGVNFEKPRGHHHLVVRRVLPLGRLLDAVDLMYDEHGEFVAGSGDWDELFDAALEIRAACYET